MFACMHGAFAVAEADAKLKGYLETAADCIYTIENSPTAQEDLRAVGTQKYVCPLERSSFVRRVPCLPGVCWSSRRCSWLTRSSVPWCVRVCVSGARSVPVQTVLVLEAVIVLLSPKHAFSGPNPSVFGASWAASHRLLLLPPPELARRLREVRGPLFRCGIGTLSVCRAAHSQCCLLQLSKLLLSVLESNVPPGSRVGY